MQNRWNFLKTGFYEGINVDVGRLPPAQPQEVFDHFCSRAPGNQVESGPPPACALLVGLKELVKPVSQIAVTLEVDGHLGYHRFPPITPFCHISPNLYSASQSFNSSLDRRFSCVPPSNPRSQTATASGSTVN